MTFHTYTMENMYTCLGCGDGGEGLQISHIRTSAESVPLKMTVGGMEPSRWIHRIYLSVISINMFH